MGENTLDRCVLIVLLHANYPDVVSLTGDQLS